MKKFLLTSLLASVTPWLSAASAPDEATRRSPDYFFRPSERSTAPADQLYPKGKEFFFGFYSIGGGLLADDHAIAPQPERDAVLARFRKAGVTLLGPQYELNPFILEDAKKHDYGVIYSVGLDMKFHSGEPLELTPEEITQQVREKVAAAAGEERIKVWYLLPEELRSWRKNEVAYFNAAVAGIREGDPQGRPVFHYDPGHRNAEALRWIAAKTDYLAKGAYTNYAKKHDQRVYIRWSIEQELEAFKAEGKEGVALLVPEMFEQPQKPDLIPTWVRHDVYLGLVSGAKGVLVFSARQRPTFPAYDRYLEAYEAVLSELKGERNFAELFLFGTRRNDLSVDIISGPQEVTLDAPSGKQGESLRYPSVHFIDLSYGEERYLFAVNSANEPVRAMMGGFSYASVEAHSLFEKVPPFVIGEGEFEAEFQPLEVKGWRYVRAKE